MNGSAGASPSRKAQPPHPPGDAAEKTVDYVYNQVSRKPTIDALLPPGAETEPAPPPVGASVPAAAAGFVVPQLAPREATHAQLSSPFVTDSKRTTAPTISPEERAQRRFWKNAILFGFFVVVLMAVCYLLAR